MNSVGKNNESSRIIWLQKTLANISPGSRILDAGAGERKFSRFCDHLQYVAQDFAKYDGKGDARGLQTGAWDQSQLDIVSDIIAIPEPDSSFDAIMCIEVFEHLPNPLAAILEFSRLLRPGGVIILTAPFCSLTHFAPYHFYTGFNRYFYETHLSANGFHIEELVENGNYFEYLAQEIRRIPTIAERYANYRTNLFELLGIRLVLNILDRLSARDTGSSELLNFGCFVRARKI
jgi:ubiquinone/menaquinone biosynthesis C-methylase UbiE